MSNVIGKAFFVNAELQYAKVFERNRDQASEKVTHPGVRKKLEETEGQYSTVLVMDKEDADFLKHQGFPDSGMSSSLWGETEDGRITYKAHRPHVNPKVTDKETGEPMYYGPPNVIDEDGEPWNPEDNLGNGTKARVKLKKYVTKAGGKIITLDGIKVIEHVPYEEMEEEF